MKPVPLFIFAVCVAGLLLAPPVTVAADKKKKNSESEEPRKSTAEQIQEELQRRLQSAPTQRAPVVRMRLANLTGRPVELVWLNPAGGQQSYGQVPPQQPGGEPATIETYPGHAWLFKSRGRVLQTYTATAARQQLITLGGDRETYIPSRPAIVEVPNPAPRNNPRAGDRLPADAAEFLQVHNEARARVGAPPLRWSDTLARFAQEWADKLASSGGFQHRDQSKTGYGENLFGGSDGYTPADAARHWLKERSAYSGGPITSQNFNAVGHYTQMVWSDTTEVGYGIARGRNGVVVVANYAPAGNRSGQKPY